MVYVLSIDGKPLMPCTKAKARFNNRAKKEGWLAPSIKHKIQSHLSVVSKIH